MDANEVTLACKRVLAIQDELLKEIKQEGVTIVKQLATIANQTEIHGNAVIEANNTLKPAVEILTQSRYKISITSVLICLVLLLSIFAACLYGAFWYGGHTRDVEFDYKLSSAISEYKTTISDSAKWAESKEGKAARELITKLLKDYNLDYAAFSSDDKKKFQSWLGQWLKK